ncbi:MAG: nucleotide sugar dehydrogenase [Pseudohongiellaceae bacterium]
MKRISVFGLGYVGCVSAACFADDGYEVIGCELNQDKVKLINEGKSPIVEPGLDDLMARVVKSGKLRATGSCDEAITNSDMAFVCVGTPGDGHGKLGLTALENVCREIGGALRGTTRPYTVIIRSTVLPGTALTTVYPELLAGAGEEFKPYLKVAVNPEFIREGTALKDFENPPLTLVGCDDKSTATALRSVYASLDAPFVQTEFNTAEAVKYVCNAYHALKVCFANEIGDACDALGADPQEVMRIFRLDKKLNLSEAYLRPGFAFGGSCLPKDVKALLYAAHHANVGVPLLDSILPSNRLQIDQAIDKVLATGKRRIGILGLSFKKDTDDLRESPMVTLVESLIGKGCDIRIVDRNVSMARLTGANRRYIEEEIPHIATLMCDNVNALLDQAQVLVIGNDSEEAQQAVERATTAQCIVDLTRGGIESVGRSRAAA